jgi:predicted AAA+ superfamily ATPase
MAAFVQIKKSVKRRALDTAQKRLTTSPVVAIVGPRASGKSTVLAELAASLGVEVLDLDDPAVQRAVSADPGRFLESERPVLIDEYARVPETLEVIKRLLNRDARPGRFVLAGSTRYGAVPAIAQSLTGRVDIVPLWPLSQGELVGSREVFVEQLLAGETPSFADVAVDRESYAERVAYGGMPMALRLPNAAARARWFEQYVQLTLEKDVAELAQVRRRVVLPKVALAVAARTGQLLSTTDIAKGLEADRKTVEEYLRLLEAVFLHYVLPAWGTTLLSRAAAKPKVHFLDTGLASRLLRVTPEKLLAAKASAQQQFGHLLETFVVGEILKQTHWLDAPVDVGHWRTHDGQEVDLVIERMDGSVLAIEVKASPDVRAEDLRGIRALQKKLGQDQVTGVVLHTGKSGWRIDAGTIALPIARIWQPA